MSGYFINPRFFGGAKGDLFTLNVKPNKKSCGHAIYLPPIGEELNRCRATIATHAKAFASAGIECTVIDYFGTGDSDGDFCQGELSLWLEDLSALIASITSDSSLPVYLVGFRLGALIAMAYINDNPGIISSSLLIQPVTGGKQFVTQLLRQRMAGQLSMGLPADSTEQMRLSLGNINSIEIGGYEFNSTFLLELDKMSVKDFTQLSNNNFHWLEFEPAAGKGLSIASQRTIESLEKNGNIVEASCVNDPPIWQLHERAIAPKNIELVRMVIKKW